MKEIIKVEGMTCGHCKKAVELALSKLDFIEDFDVDLEKGQISLAGKDINLGKIKEIIEDLGFIVK